MSETRNNVTTVFSADISNFTKSTQELNRYISTVNAEFQEATAGMGKWSDTTDGLQAKIKQLNGTLDAQKRKLADTEQAYNKMRSEGKENTAEAQKLYIKLKEQQAQVKKTEASIADYTDQLNDLGNESKEAGEGVSNLGGVLKGIGGVVAGAGAAVGGLVTGFLALAESTREHREDLSRLSAAFEGAGQSAATAEETYKTLYRAIGENDTTVEAAQQIALLANSEEEAAKWASLATGVVGTFGDALTPETFFEAANETIKLGEATGAFTQMLEGTGVNVEQFNKDLAACTTEAEKQALMLAVSEKSLGKAGEAYEETAGSILDARDAEAELNQALNDLGAIAEPIMTTLKLLAADLLKDIEPFVELIGEGLTGALAGSEGAADTFAEGIGGIFDALINRITEMLPMVLNIILELMPSLADTLLSALPQLLGVVTELVVQILNLASTLLPQIVAKIVELIPMLITQLLAAVPQLLEAATTLLLAIVQALPTIIANLVAELPNLINTILSAVLTAFPLLLSAAIELFNALIDALPVIIAALTQNLPRIITTIVNAVVQAVPLLLAGAIQLFNAIVDAIPEIIPVIMSDLPQITTTIIDTLLESVPDLIGAGAELIGGVVTGMLDPKNWLDGVKAVGTGIVNAFEDFFDINSPSKVMADKIGKFAGLGVGKGLVDSESELKRDINHFSGFVTDQLGGGIAAGIGASGAGNHTTNNNKTVNVYQTFEAQKPTRYALRQAKYEAVTALKMA